MVVVPVLAGGVTAAVVAPAAGIPIALATFVALVGSYGRALLAVGSVGLLVAVDRMVSAAQGKFHYLAEFGWPTHFETASILAWLAVAALAADALVQEVPRGAPPCRCHDRGTAAGRAAADASARQARARHVTRREGPMLRSTG